MHIDKLPEGITMQLYLHTRGTTSATWRIIFSSSKRWLHPLFELGEFLAIHSIDGDKDCRTLEFDGNLRVSSSDLVLRDRIIGLAAAYLILRLGIRRVETDIISCGAAECRRSQF
jgi:hypothetical protein